MDGNNKWDTLFAIVLELFLGFVFVCYILIMCILIYDPRGVIFLGDLVPLKYYHFPVPLLIILFHAYVRTFCHIMPSIMVGAALAYGYFFTPILIRELRLGRISYRTSRSLRMAKNARHEYRSLQILQANIFSLVGLFLGLFNAIFTIITVWMNFVLMRYWEELKIITKLQLLAWTSSIMGFWVVVLELGHFQQSKCLKMQGSWKTNNWENKKRDTFMKKFLRSCKPIVLSYGRQFVIGRVSVLVYFRGVVRGTFRALLTTKK